MNIEYIAGHTVKPQFVAGQNYEAKIVAVVDKESGFTMELGFEELSVPGYWHFNVATAEELPGYETWTPEMQKKRIKAKQIADDELKGLIELIGEPIADTAELLGKTIDVRLTSAPDSNLPHVGLPIQSKRGNKLSL